MCTYANSVFNMFGQGKTRLLLGNLWGKTGERLVRKLNFQHVWSGKDYVTFGERLGKDWERLGVFGERLVLGSRRTVGKQAQRGERLPTEEPFYNIKRSTEVGPRLTTSVAPGQVE